MNNTTTISDVQVVRLEQTLMWPMKLTTYNTLKASHHDE
jgi:hypothetical protein